MKKANPFTHGGFAFFAVYINYVFYQINPWNMLYFILI